MTEVRNFSKIGSAMEIPDLAAIQRESYEQFLQVNVSAKRRKAVGLEAIIAEIFPIEDEGKTIRLKYLYYTLGASRYTPEECRELGLTYGMPLRLRLRLHKGAEVIEEDVYLGEMPVMMGGGEFIINGSERVIVTQLHRSPGCDFSVEGRRDEELHSCRIIPERGSWMEMEVGRSGILTCRLDRSGKIPATLVLRALSEKYSEDSSILKLFYDVEKVSFTKGTAAAKLRGRVSADSVALKGEDLYIVKAGEKITDETAQKLAEARTRSIKVLPASFDPLIVETLNSDRSSDHASAVRELYARLRPGTPFNLQKAKQMIGERFFDENRYQIGRAGRFRMNRKFGENVPIDCQTLRPEDFVNCLRYILMLRAGEGHVDDIDHLGNRRVRTIGELAGDELRKGFLRMRRTVEDRINLKDPEKFTPRSLVNSKTVSAAINYFFGRSELSQVVQQTNPLDELTHERRLSALGPGGLNRKRAGFEVRDVHISHYGRICPIETPEGTNIGLITSLGVYARLDEYGFLVTPYRVVKKGKVTNEIHYLRADEEEDACIAPADVELGGKKPDDRTMARVHGDFLEVAVREVQYCDVSPQQIVGVSASLIPFLEHSDANRALMGSNMQRQAVPLLRTEAPIICTGAEAVVAGNSGMVRCAEKAGTVTYVDGGRIVIGETEYVLRKFEGLNQRTCLNQRPLVREGQKVAPGHVIADGAATCGGELSLGKNVLVAFMPWEGYNFEDAVVVSTALVEQDAYTSLHMESFEVEIRETKLGREEFTCDIPNVSEDQLRNLDEDGIILEGTWVGPGDILVGKVCPKSRSELSPEEKLLYAIFGKAGEDVRNDSLAVPSDVEGVVVETRKFSRRSYLSEEKRKELDAQVRAVRKECNAGIAEEFRVVVAEMEEAARGRLTDSNTGDTIEITSEMSDDEVAKTAEDFDPMVMNFGPKLNRKVRKAYRAHEDTLEKLLDERARRIERINRGDELPSGVLEMVKVYVATKRKLSLGDKMAGRHGNKGVIAKILPKEEMPFLADGTSVDVILNPLGVPGRMNVGQILETHLSWAARALGFRAVTPVFDGAGEEEIRECLKEAGFPEDGKAVVYDGRTGEPFEQRITVGYMYMMKLDHLADDKVHARATGPYSLITQQPLGGKARYGGQRFGEMEGWALEAYGAAHILQELFTVKSDDVDGRTKIYESMVKGTNVLEPGIPVAFEVLCNELRGIGLNIQLVKGGAL